MSERVIVIGAGINGLVAANYLRRAGWAVTMIERSDRVGGACVSEVATVHGHTQRYALGASVLGLMQEFVFRETGLAGRLQTYVPDEPKRGEAHPESDCTGYQRRAEPLLEDERSCDDCAHDSANADR